MKLRFYLKKENGARFLDSVVVRDDELVEEPEGFVRWVEEGEFLRPFPWDLALLQVK